MMSGPFRPAACTRINTSPGPGDGTGLRRLSKTSGPPAADISTTVISAGIPCIRTALRKRDVASVRSDLLSCRDGPIFFQIVKQRKRLIATLDQSIGESDEMAEF